MARVERGVAPVTYNFIEYTSGFGGGGGFLLDLRFLGFIGLLDRLDIETDKQLFAV